MVIALICLSLLLVYPLVGLLVYSLRERSFYHRTGKKYVDLFQEKVDKAREKAEYYRSREDNHAQYMFDIYSGDLERIEKSGFWEIKEVKESLNWAYFWAFLGGYEAIAFILKRGWNLTYRLFKFLVLGPKAVYNFVKSNIVAFGIWVNRKVVGDLDDGSEEAGETSLGGYR